MGYEGKHVAITEDRTIIDWLTPERRKWLYGIVASAMVVAGVYGIVTAEQSAAWLMLAAAVLGVATAHTGGSYVAPVEDVK